MNKLNRQAYEKTAEQGYGLLVGYFLAGDPEPEMSIELLQETVSAGIDILEIGIPSLSPVLDGEIIRRGHHRVTQAHPEGEDWLIPFFKELRERMDVPIWAMGYKADLVDHPLYLELAEQGLIDALVLPDCSDADLDLVEAKVASFGVDVVRFVRPDMSEDEMKTVTQKSKLIYAQMYAGATGDPSSKADNALELLQKTKKLTDALVFAGFGLRNADNVRNIIQTGYDGAIVGSVFVARFEYEERDLLYRLISEMKLSATK